MATPPVGVVYQAIELPIDTALKSEEAPGHISAGVAVTLEAVGAPPTVTVTAVRVELVQAAPPDHVKITWPLPD